MSEAADEKPQSLENSAAQSSSRWRRSPAVLAGIVMAVCVLPYLFSARFAFVYDDWGSIAENPFLRQPGAFVKTLTLQTFFDPHVLDGQRPLVILSYIMDTWVWGLRPFGFHVTNILLHAAGVGLLFALPGALGAPLRVRVGAAMIFGLHPAVSEVVQIPAFREDLLATVFTFAFLLLAARGRAVASLVALALALCGKETAIVGPALLALMWLCFPQRSQISNFGVPASRDRKSQMVLLAASAAIVVAYLAVTFTHRPLQSVGQAWNGLALRWPENISTAPWLFVLALKTLVAPFPLCADYIVRAVPFSGPRFFAGLVLMAAFAAAALLLRRRQPLGAFAAGWVLVCFVPVSNIVPLFNPFADRYLHLPAAGFAMIVGAIVAHTGARRAGLAAIASLFFGLTVLRLGDWRDDETLWRATAKTEPRSARAQTWLGIIAVEKGDIAEARTRYALATELNPSDVRAIINTGILDAKSGDLAGAEQKFRAATERRPDFAEGWWNLAQALHLLGRDGEAGPVAARAASIDPYNPRAREMRKQPGGG